jgi:phosphopantetheinyl transferase
MQASSFQNVPRIVRWDQARAVDADLDTPLLIVDDLRGGRPPKEFGSVCAPLELERADRFKRPSNRMEYLRAREIIRSFLGPHVGLAPSAINLHAIEPVKPRLLDPQCAGIDVSISHAGGLVACAFIRDRDIGVDVEPLERRVGLKVKALASRVMSPIELDALALCGDAESLPLFLRAWTRKEAVLKAAGVGLSSHLHSLSVLRRVGEHVEDISPVCFEDRFWECHSLSFSPGVELSVAYSRP